MDTLNSERIRNYCAKSLLTLWACVGTATGSQAAVIYETFGPDPFVRGGNAHTVEYVFGHGRAVSTPFSFGGSYYELSSITLDIGLAGNENSPNLEIGIYGDVNGFPSLTPLASLDANPTSAAGQRQSVSYSFTPGNTLLPNTPYWLVLQPHTIAVPTADYDASYFISTSAAVPSGGFAVRTMSYPTSSEWSSWTFFNGPPPVFRLEGTAVPEPGTWALLALGTAAFWCAARRRRK
jgi:hypothetical protein